MLTFIVILQVITHLALAASIFPSTEISFSPQQEYTLPQDYALDGPQSVFAVSSPVDAPTPTFTLKARPTTVWRPHSAEIYQRARAGLESEEVEWEQVEVMGPYVEDKHTLTQLARMTGNAYALPGQKNWYEIDPTWNHVCVHRFRLAPRLLMRCVCRAFLSVGRTWRTASVGMSSPRFQIRLSFSRSRARPCRARRRRRTSSTTTCSSRAAARASTFRGYSVPFADAMRTTGGAIMGA